MEDKNGEYKHLRVKVDTHKEVKILSTVLGVSIDEAIKILIKKYNECK